MSLIMEPKIGPESLGNDPAVDLRCEAALINPSMQSWRNVSYRFTWYMEGKHIHTDDVCGILEPGRSEYESECPGKPLFSRLHGKYYKPNRLVSFVAFVLFMPCPSLSEMSMICHNGKISQKDVKTVYHARAEIMHMTCCMLTVSLLLLLRNERKSRFMVFSSILACIFFAPKDILQCDCAVYHITLEHLEHSQGCSLSLLCGCKGKYINNVITEYGQTSPAS